MEYYSEAFRSKMVQRMLGPDAVSATALSKEVGVSQAALSKWLLKARTLGPMAKKGVDRAEGGKVEGRRTAEEKVRLVLAASRVKPEELGAFLRREGIHEAELNQWRAIVEEAGKEALSPGGAGASVRTALGKRIQELEREVQRKDRALAEAGALLLLQKKLRRLLGDEDEGTPRSNGQRS